MKHALRSPIPPNASRPLPSVRMDRGERGNKKLLANDASLAVLYFNASRGTDSHDRLVWLWRELQDLRAEDLKLKQLGVEMDKETWPKGLRGPVRRSATKKYLALAAESNALHAALDLRHSVLLERLAKYAWRPVVSYTLTADEWRVGIVPVIDEPDSFQVQVGRFRVTEGDALEALLRLSASRRLDKVKLCEGCKAKWLVAIRPAYDRFCPGKLCRDSLYLGSPGYKERKAKNQAKYRKNLKRAIALGANIKEPKRKARRRHAL